VYPASQAERPRRSGALARPAGPRELYVATKRTLT
jgi:hypothetical protein